MTTTRTYNQTRRAEQQAATRRRIVEAAVELHSSLGPARTTVSMVAERAGVQRHTLYAHFPDERSLFLACSSLSLERDPLPDPEPWRALAPGAGRLAAGIGALYGWYDRNASLAGCVLRDAEVHETTREMAELRIAPVMATCADILGAGLAARQQAMLRLALSFHTFRTLARDAGLDPARAAQAMVRAIDAAA